MSTVMRSGMSAGRHSISTSRRHEIHEPALGLDADGFAEELDRNRDADGLVHGDLDQVGVQQLVRRRIDLQRP